MKYKFLCLLLLSLNNITIAQTAAWTTKFNGSANKDDAISAMATDAAGNVYVTGYANNGITGTDYVTIKYNTKGKRIWMAVYDGPGSGNDVANAITVDKSGNVYVTGLSDALTGAFIDNDAATVKYDANGNQLWVARYDGGVGRGDAGRAIKTDDAGNVYITGYTSERSGAHSDFNYLTVKYNATGVQQWAAVYAGPAKAPNDQNDSANSIALDTQGNVYVTGMSNGDNDGVQNLNQDYLTIKYNAAGVGQWTARYNGTGKAIDEAFALVTNAQGDVFVTGLSTGANNNSYDFATLKYSTDGKLKWTQRHDGPAIFSADGAYAIAMDNTGDVIVTGTDQAIANNEDIYTVEYSNAGVQQWSARYDGGDNDDPSSLSLDRNGNIYVAGYSMHVNTGADAIVIKYNNHGQQQWKQEFRGSNGFTWDVWNAVGVDSLNNVYVAGYTTDNNSGTDYRVVKYSQDELITGHTTKNSDVKNFVLFQNTPNPFTSATTISFQIQNNDLHSSATKLWIEDAQGNVLNILLNKTLSNGTYQVHWDAKDLLPGLYYCKLSCGDAVEVKKMILTK